MAEKIYEALIGIRADNQQLRADLQRAQTELRGGLLLMRNLASNLAPTLSIGAIGAFVNQVVDLGGQLTDLAQRLDISAQALSGIQSVLEENGTSIEAFASSMSKAQKNLGEIKSATDPAALAIKELGLNLDELRNGTTEEFIEKVSAALSKQENNFNRAALGAAIFGREFAALAPALTEIGSRFAELKRQGISEADIKLLDDYGDAWTRFATRVKIEAGGFIADAIRDLETITKLVRNNILLFNAWRAGAGSAATGGLVGAAGISEALRNATQTADRARTPFRPPAGGAAGRSADDTQSFLAGLEKQIDALRQNQIELTQGATAAKAYGLELEFAAHKQKLIEDGKPIPAGLEASFQRAKTAIIELTNESEKLKISLEQSFSARRLAEEEQEFEAIAADRKRTLDELNRATEEGIKIRAGVSPDLQRQLVSNIEATLAKEQEEANFLSRAYGPSFDQAGSKVERLKKALESLKSTGIGADEPTVRALTQQLQTEQVNEQFQGLRRELDLAGKQAVVFGGEFNGTGVAIDATRQAITNLLRNGLDPLDPRIEQLRQQLKGLEGVERLSGIFDSLGDSLADALIGVFDPSKSIGEKARELGLRLAQDLSREFSNELSKQISGSLKDLLLGKDNGSGRTGGLLSSALEFLRGGNILQGGAQSAASGAVNGTSSNAAGVVAIESLSTLAQTALEASVLASQTSIEALSAVAVGSLESATAVSVAGIGAVEAAALAAIAAAAAGGGGGSGEEIVDDALSGLFDLISSSEFHNGGPVKRFAAGGNVLGSGEVPAILHAGEFVLRKQIVDAIGVETLQRVNRGGLPAFELGGLVMASNPIRSTRPADLRPQTTDGERGGRRSPEVHVEVNGSIIKNPNIPDEQVIRVWAKDYRGWGVTRAMIKGDR